MAMYNLVFGNEGPTKRGQLLMAVLGYEALNDVGRYRDSWVETSDKGPVIAIYTRNGGGNRDECWRWSDEPRPATADSRECDCPACKANHFIPSHPNWFYGADDSFDETYRTEYFLAPDEYREALAEVATEPIDTSQKWLDAIAQLKAMQGEEESDVSSR